MGHYLKNDRVMFCRENGASVYPVVNVTLDVTKFHMKLSK